MPEVEEPLSKGRKAQTVPSPDLWTMVGHLGGGVCVLQFSEAHRIIASVPTHTAQTQAPQLPTHVIRWLEKYLCFDTA